MIFYIIYIEERCWYYWNLPKWTSPRIESSWLKFLCNSDCKFDGLAFCCNFSWNNFKSFSLGSESSVISLRLGGNVVTSAGPKSSSWNENLINGKFWFAVFFSRVQMCSANSFFEFFHTFVYKIPIIFRYGTKNLHQIIPILPYDNLTKNSSKYSYQ